MSQSIPVTAPRFRGKLRRTTLLVFLPLSLIPVAFVGFLTISNTNNFISAKEFADGDAPVRTPVNHNDEIGLFAISSTM
jgi:hypothetical protein